MVISSAFHMWTRNFFKFICNKYRLKPLESMATMEALQKLEIRALEAENLISSLKAEVADLQKAADFCKHHIEVVNVKKFEEVMEENKKLKKEIEEWKTRLDEAEKLETLSIPSSVQKILPTVGFSFRQETVLDKNVEEKAKASEKNVEEKVKASEKNVEEKAKASEKNVEEKARASEKNVKAKASEKNVKEKAKASEKKEKKAEKNAGASSEDDLPVDVGRLDIRVGKIVNVTKHPEADFLYVEQVDVGEAKPRTVLSGLVKYVPIELMMNRMVIALCNLKPAKMRGVTSEAMVLCASTPDKVEILSPPEGSRPGDKIFVEGYPPKPDPVLNPKKKIFETVAPDLKTDAQKIATYKGLPLMVSGRGVVTCESLAGVPIK